jgi:hypothetical protein
VIFVERFADDLPMLYAMGADGHLKFVDEVENGLACGCTCPACGQALIARNGGTRLIHHFAHRTNACAWAIEAIVCGLAADALRDAGRMRLPALFYHDAERDADVSVSPSRIMAVTGVEERAISGRGVPDLLVTVSAKSTTRTFALVCVLTHRLTDAETARLMAEVPGVLVLDLASDLRRRRAELGKHYDRVEVLRGYQDPGLVGECLSGEDALVLWAANDRAAGLERKSEERLQAAEARRAAEEEERKRQAAERDARLRLEREERRRDMRERYEAEREDGRRRLAKLEYRESEELRRMTEELRGARGSSGSQEVEYDPETLDVDYDIRTWPELKRLPRGSLRSFGELRALIAVRDGRLRHVVLCGFRPYEIREVALHLAELKIGSDELAVVFVAADVERAGDIVAVYGDEEICWFGVASDVLYAALGSLEAILEARVSVKVNLAGGSSGRLLSVVADKGLFAIEMTEGTRAM